MGRKETNQTKSNKGAGCMIWKFFFMWTAFKFLPINPMYDLNWPNNRRNIYTELKIRDPLYFMEYKSILGVASTYTHAGHHDSFEYPQQMFYLRNKKCLVFL